jgi:hypothetical protein
VRSCDVNIKQKQNFINILRNFTNSFVKAMKKFAIAILAVLYLGTSVGAIVHLHYCMGQLVNLSLWDSNSNSSECSKCGMQKNHGPAENGCCKDEQKVLKNSNDQKLTQSAVYLIHATSVPHLISHNELPAINLSLTRRNPISHAPPHGQIAIYISNRVFLI